MKGIIILIGMLFFWSVSAMAQPENATVETVNGKKYYVHFVEQGNTLYGIHRLYDASVESILSANEGLTNDLTVGQKIYIPIATDNQNHYGRHTVAQGETLYGISRKYKCSVDDLKQINKGLSEGISPGQVIIVPKAGQPVQAGGEVIQSDPEPNKPQYKISLSDSLVEHTVLQHETMYAIAKRYMVSADTIKAVNKMRNNRIRKGDVLLIPVKKVNYEVIEKDINDLSSITSDSLPVIDYSKKMKDSYNVALMLPLMLDRNEQEMARPLKLNQARELYATTGIAFGFYQGFLLAADSLSKAGMNVNLYVYDTKNDTNTVARLFKKKEFTDMDLVVGPLFRKTIKYAARECARRHIRIVLPFNADTEVLYHNPYAYKAVASNMTLLDGTIDYLLEKHKHHNIILIKPTMASDLALYERAKERFNLKVKEVNGAYNTAIVESGQGSSSGRDLNGLLRKDTTNVFIVPSTNPMFVAGVMSRLNKVMNMNPYAKNLRVIAFGLEEWNKFDDLDIKYRNRTEQHYASYRFVDYNQGNGLELVKAFRNQYGTDPNVYATQGFDVGMYFLSALHLYGTNFDLAIERHKIPLVQNDYFFRSIDPLSGKENQHVCIVKYDNYKLLRLN